MSDARFPENNEEVTPLLERADAFVRTKGHDPYTRIGEADELIEELSAELEAIQKREKRVRAEVMEIGKGPNFDVALRIGAILGMVES